MKKSKELKEMMEDLNAVELALEQALSRTGASNDDLLNDAIWAAQVFDSAFKQLPIRIRERFCEDAFRDAVSEKEEVIRARMRRIEK